MKKGFTLIELMVVIVIIGILAAIAVPKMFGLSAKAKASELLPSWGSWKKVSQAYALETSSVGAFTSIGFVPPGVSSFNDWYSTSNWSYAGGAVATTPVANSSDLGYFSARNIIDLNNCPKGIAFGAPSVASANLTTWVATFNPSGEILSKAAQNSNCSVLTPAFK